MNKKIQHVFVGLWAILALGSGSNALGAQNPQTGTPGRIPTAEGAVRGKVVEGQSKAPLSNTGVAVRSAKDSSLVSGAITGEDGSFRVSGLRPGAYYLRVTRIGFGPKFQSFSISPEAPLASIGSVEMKAVAVSLSEVAVTAERSAMTIEPDRNAYVAKSVAPAAANASEVLDAVPSVQVDPDGKVSLRGNENVVVQINGRASPMRGDALGAFLKQLPAGAVDKIEVIPNPSAKQDPEGMAGIINIVLKENVDLGVSGGVSVSAASGDRLNGNGNLGYQAGKLTTFSSYGYNRDQRNIIGINNRERFNALGQTVLLTLQDIDGLQERAGHNLTATADYKLNKRDVITNALLANWRASDENTANAYRELDGAGVMFDQYNRFREVGSQGSMFDYALAWKRTLDPKKHELNSELRFNRNREEDNSLLWRQANAPAVRIENEIIGTDALTRQLTAQVDYTKMLTPKRKLEAGFKSNSRWLDREYEKQQDLTGGGIYLPSALSNSFEFSEKVQAVYGVLGQNVGKLDWQAGLRAEYAHRDFALANTNENFPHSYTSLFPSGIINYKVSEQTGLKVSYSRRIRRPGTQELNPFPTFFDAQNVFIGNPRLNPEYTDAFELGLTRSGQFYTLQVAPFWRHTADIIRADINTEDVIDGREVTSVSFKNLATSNSWGTDINSQIRAGRVSGLVGLNIYKIVTDGGTQSTLASDAVAWSVRLNGNAQLTKTLTLSGMYRYQGPIKIERGEFGAFQMSNFSLRQKVWGEKGALSLRVVDPFNTMGIKVKTGNDLLLQQTERKFGARGVFLGFQYNFGQAPKIKAPTQPEQPEGAGFPTGG